MCLYVACQEGCEKKPCYTKSVTVLYVTLVLKLETSW